MQRPKPYAVLNGMTTPDEPHQGWYYSTENDHGDMDIHGPFSTRMGAEEAIDNAEMDTLENAQARAEYWKAEHNAANAEIDRLKATVARVEAVAAEFEGMTGSGYRYMAAHVRDAIKVPNV